MSQNNAGGNFLGRDSGDSYYRKSQVWYSRAQGKDCSQTVQSARWHHFEVREATNLPRSKAQVASHHHSWNMKWSAGTLEWPDLLFVLPNLSAKTIWGTFAAPSSICSAVNEETRVNDIFVRRYMGVNRGTASSFWRIDVVHGMRRVI